MTLLFATACAPAHPPSTSQAEGVGSGASLDGRALGTSTLRGRLIDLRGEPVAGVLVTASDDYCVPARSAEDGSFAVRRVREGEQRLITYGETSPRGRYASLVLPVTVEGDTTLREAIRLPELGESHPLDPDAAEAQTIVSADGLELDILPGSLTLAPFFEPELRVARVPLAHAPPFVPAGVELHDLFVLHPIRSSFDPPAPLRFPPDPRLRPGAAVSVYALDYETGSLARVARGVVDDAGAPTTNPGQGLRELTWIAVEIHD